VKNIYKTQVRPSFITGKGMITNIQQDGQYDSSAMRELETFDASEVAYDTNRPERDNIEEADQAEEEPCVQPRLIANANFEQSHLYVVSARNT
jgi:hypothetical protein